MPYIRMQWPKDTITTCSCLQCLAHDVVLLSLAGFLLKITTLETNVFYQNIPDKCGKNRIPNMQADC